MSQNSINFKLPIIDINKIRNKFSLSLLEEKILSEIIYNPTNGVGVLRATRPKQAGPLCSWVWRNLMMLTSPEEKFHYVAVSFDEYIGEALKEISENQNIVANKDDIESTLTQLIEKILSTLSPDELHGVNNWRSALGT